MRSGALLWLTSHRDRSTNPRAPLLTIAYQERAPHNAQPVVCSGLPPTAGTVAGSWCHQTPADGYVSLAEAGRWWSVKKANGCGSRLGGSQEWWILVDTGKTEVGFQMLGGGESFEGHEVQPDTVIDEARHRPCQFSQREKPDRIGKARHRFDGCCAHSGVGAAKGAGEHPYHGAITDRPTKAVIPKSGCEDATAARA